MAGKNDKYRDSKVMTEAREAFFDGNTLAVDDITEKTLHSDSNAAKRKYGQHHYTEHTADVDHIIPCERARRILERNPYLSGKDIKAIINSKSNLHVTSSRLNRSKQAKSNLHIALDPNIRLRGKARLVGHYAKAGLGVVGQTAVRTAANVGSELATGAVDSLSLQYSGPRILDIKTVEVKLQSHHEKEALT